MTTRRNFLQTSALGAFALTTPSRSSRAVRQTRALVGLDELPRGAVADPAGVRKLAQRALEAAQAAGAPYAEVRVTRQPVRSSGR